MQDSLLQQGLDLTLYGMGIVFTFLLLLVIGTGIMSRIITRFLPEPEPAAPTIKNGNKNGPANDARLRAVIKAAIEQHRKNKNRR